MAVSETEFGGSIRRKHFGFKEGYSFVNHGSFGAVPARVRRRQKQLLDISNANPDEFYKLTERRLYGQARGAIADFLGSKPENLVFVQNSTTGCNTVLRSVPWSTGDEILASNFTFGANINACRNITESIKGKFHQFEIRFPIHDSYEVLKSMTSYLDVFPKIRLVLLDHISRPSALVLPLKEMIAECRRRRVLVMVDGAHAVGQLKINLEDLGADFYFGSCSKWLYTPRGCAVLWIAEQHQKWCAPLVVSLKHRTGFQSEFRCQGTRDNVPYLAVPEALQFLEDIGGLEKVHDYTRVLLRKACSILEERLGAKPVEIPASMEAPNIRLIQLPRFTGYPVTYEGARQLNLYLLEHHKVVCLVCAIQGQFHLRLSVNVYNEVCDFVKLADALCELSGPGSTQVYPVTYKCKM